MKDSEKSANGLDSEEIRWTRNNLAIASFSQVFTGAILVLVSGPLRVSIFPGAPFVGIALRYVGIALLVIGFGIWVSMWRARMDHRK